MSQYAYLSDPDPEFAAASANAPGFPHTTDVEFLRNDLRNGIAYFNEAAKHLRPADSEYRVEEHKVPVEGGEILVRCLIPTPQGGESGPYPLLVNYHGGGWTVGDLDTDDMLLRHLCVNLKLSVVSVDYRLAPEHPYPTPRNDSYEALKWAAEHAVSFDASTAKGFIVHGMSAGGNLVADVAHRARDDPFFQQHPLTGQYLHFPAVVHYDHVPEKYKSELLSYRQNAENLTLPGRAMRLYLELYGADPTDEDVFTLLKSDHTRLPPAVVQVCGQDPLRDEGILYTKVLQEAGVKSKLYVYPGVPHAFFMGCPHIKQAKKYMEDMRAGLQWLLEQAA